MEQSKFKVAQLDVLREEIIRSLSQISGTEIDTLVLVAADSKGQGPIMFKGVSLNQAHMLLTATDKMEELHPGIMIEAMHERMVARGVDFLKELFPDE